MEDSGSRLPAQQDFPHLFDAHWITLEKMVSLLGEAAFAGFSNLPAEQQRARVERFDKYESSLIAYVSAAAQEAARATMRAEAQSAAQASATNTASFAARPTTTKPVKMSVPTFDGKDSDSLVFWVREIEIALSAGQIYDARAQVAFSLSNLGGLARAWAMARETATPGYFTSWSFMEQELRSTFLLANVAYRHRSSFLRCKQGKQSLQDYVMELHNLEATMAGPPLSEDVKVTVFMDGARTDPVRTELFRRQPKTFNEAVNIAMLEDHCVRSAKGTRLMSKQMRVPLQWRSLLPSRHVLRRRNGRVVAVSVVTNLVTSVETAPPTHGRRPATRSTRRVRLLIASRRQSRKTATPSRGGKPCWETSLLVEEGESLTSLSKGASPWDDTSVFLRGRRAV
ncbi:hypothetical protein PF010_g20711 [Phytophthora fragariae]|uniref:Retrotransposon gag domain-containing protein n=1 Tax=Phytophthora fragariae TaxID=53985 RepID=A0A6A3SCN2_9STRA|nr:hypothetical protein PF003_g30824 [Phytophthora fragariae]KAE9059404.1 hypothetical protein PF007_g30968 [Phytophthora fragariae]KAE9084757.1 hypothetical protein PF010_g20711 [Phytophthora fragariae]KAE9113491.1 hypothetical protein PF006_g19731 [Phytophthora fragariae]KAE9197533.1 hypothetical protein PF004_g19797 [Phytophthora fragariae]